MKACIYFCAPSFFPRFLGQETQFSVKVEASSSGGVPQVGKDADTSPSKLSKEELIQSMDRVDREIAKVEQQIFKLKKKQVCSLTKHRCMRERPKHCYSSRTTCFKLYAIINFVNKELMAVLVASCVMTRFVCLNYSQNS